MEHGDLDAAVKAYDDALALAPEVGEVAFWAGITLAANGREAEALPLLARAYADEPRLRLLVPRLPASGLLPDDEALVARLAAAGQAQAPGEAGADDAGGDAGDAPAPPREPR
jgi:tetratricopeptide (TPR) repeat protein